MRFTETVLDQNRPSSWRIDARDEEERWIEQNWARQSSLEPGGQYCQLEGDDWATVTVERTMYDKEVAFDGVPAI